MTDRYDIITAMFQEALAVIPADISENIRLNGVKREEMVENTAVPGVFTNKYDDYIDALQAQYPLTTAVLDEYYQKLDAAIDEMLNLFDQNPIHLTPLRDCPVSFPIDATGFRAVAEDMLPLVVMRMVIQDFPVKMQPSKTPAFGKFTNRYASLLNGN